MRTALLLFLFGCSRAPRAEDRPLDAARGPVRHIADGVTAFIEGKELAEAMKPWPVADPEDPELLRGRIRAEGMKSAACLGMEFEIGYWKSGAGVGSARVTVFVGEKGGGILEFEPGPPACGSNALSDLRTVPELAAAAESISRALGTDLPFADPAEVARAFGWTQPGQEKKIVEMIAEARGNYAAWKRPDSDAVRVDVDDILLVGRDADGKIVGTFRSEFRKSDGKVRFRLRSLK